MTDKIENPIPGKKPPLNEFMDSIEWMIQEAEVQKIKRQETHDKTLVQIDESIKDNKQLLVELKELMALKEQALTAKAPE